MAKNTATKLHNTVFCIFRSSISNESTTVNSNLSKLFRSCSADFRLRVIAMLLICSFG